MRPCRGAATSISDRRCGVASADPWDCAQAGKVCKPRPATPRSKSWRLSCNRYVTWSSIGDIPFGSLLAHNQMERMLTLATCRLAQCAVHCCHLYEATSGLTLLPGFLRRAGARLGNPRIRFPLEEWCRARRFSSKSESWEATSKKDECPGRRSVQCKCHVCSHLGFDLVCFVGRLRSKPGAPC